MVRTPVFIIAEAGVNHDGSLDKALALVDVAARSGADAIKFQTFRTEEVVTRTAAKARYQETQTGGGTQFEMIKALELSEDDHASIAERCHARGIEFMSTPFAAWAIDLLVGLGMRRVKIASGEIVNKPLIQRVARARLPIILSTGMSTMDEARRAVDWIKDEWRAAGHEPSPGDLTVLHCTSEYPAPPSTINLRAMNTLGAELGVPVGYSDHSVGHEIAVAAVALGARVIEKHFTLDRNAFGPDHKASLSPEQLVELVQAIRNVEEAMGSSKKVPSDIELPTRQLVRRSAFATRPIAAGEVLTQDMIIFLRPGDGIGPERIDDIIGSVMLHDLEEGAKLAEGDLG